IPAPDSVNPQLDAELSAWIARLLIKDPGRRTRSAADAWEDLEDIVIRLSGSRWHREARLVVESGQSIAVRTQTPIPLTGETPPEPAPEPFTPAPDSAAPVDDAIAALDWTTRAPPAGRAG